MFCVFKTCPSSYCVSLLVCDLSYQVFISSVTFYFELHYSSVCWFPAGLTKGLCWTISHSVMTHWLASTHSYSWPASQPIGQQFKHASLCLFIHLVSHQSLCSISARQLSSAEVVELCMDVGLRELWLQLNCAIGQKYDTEWRPSAFFSDYLSTSFVYIRLIFASSSFHMFSYLLSFFHR